MCWWVLSFPCHIVFLSACWQLLGHRHGIIQHISQIFLLTNLGRKPDKFANFRTVKASHCNVESAVSVAFGPCVVFVEEERFAYMFDYVDVCVCDFCELACPWNRSVEKLFGDGGVEVYDVEGSKRLNRQSKLFSKCWHVTKHFL